MKIKALCAVLVPIVAVGGFCLRPRSHSPAAAPASQKPAAAAPVAAATAVVSSHESAATESTAAVADDSIGLHRAFEQQLVQVDFRGNGREFLRAAVANVSGSKLKIQVPVGQVFMAGRNAIAVVRPAEMEIEPGQTAEANLQTVALRSSNRMGEMGYALSYNKTPRLQPLLDYVQSHLELSAGAIQTAALAVLENLPLSAVAKFTSASGELKSRFNTDAFRVETFDIITALTALREMGVPDNAVAMTVDQQLRVESMIEPLCRTAAMHYYGITAANEWDFWRNELLAGDPSTRHYALYGIARFFPDTALEMLPKWAREVKTNQVYRLSAVQALAETQRPEAVPILNELSEELGPESELGRAALGAAMVLEQKLNQRGNVRTAVASRAPDEQATQF